MLSNDLKQSDFVLTSDVDMVHHFALNALEDLNNLGFAFTSDQISTLNGILAIRDSVNEAFADTHKEYLTARNKWWKKWLMVEAAKNPSEADLSELKSLEIESNATKTQFLLARNGEEITRMFPDVFIEANGKLQLSADAEVLNASYALLSRARVWAKAIKR